MDKALEMGQASAKGSLWLFIGKMLSTVILAIGVIVLGWFISESDYGLYTIALIPACFNPITGCSRELPQPKFFPAKITSPGCTFLLNSESRSSSKWGLISSGVEQV